MAEIGPQEFVLDHVIKSLGVLFEVGIVEEIVVVVVSTGLQRKRYELQGIRIEPSLRTLYGFPRMLDIGRRFMWNRLVSGFRMPRMRG